MHFLLLISYIILYNYLYIYIYIYIKKSYIYLLSIYNRMMYTNVYTQHQYLLENYVYIYDLATRNTCYVLVMCNSIAFSRNNI